MTERTGRDRSTSTSSGIEGTDRRSPAANAGRSTPTGIDAPGLAVWFAGHVADVELPLSYRLITGGHSNLTFQVVDAAGRRYVLRRPPTGHLLPTAHDMGREHRIIAALSAAGAPVPKAVGCCDDAGVTGAAFFVMSFVDGPVLRDEADVYGVFDAAARYRIGESMIDTLCGIHTLDPDRIGLGDLSRRDGYIARQLKRWYAQYVAGRDEHGGPDVAEVDAVHAALAARIPPQAETVVVHGDYRLDNTVIGADAQVAAVLDWELCSLGDPMADLGQLLVYWTEPDEVSPLGRSATAAAGFPTRPELAARYAGVSGRGLDHLDFYLTFAYWKLACILEGVYTRYATGAMGSDDVDYEVYPRSIRELAGRAAATVARLA